MTSLINNFSWLNCSFNTDILMLALVGQRDLIFKIISPSKKLLFKKKLMTIIYHNPRCSKSRTTLELLNNRGITPEIILYLDNPPNLETLGKLVTQLGCSINNIIRKSDSTYTELGLAEKKLSEAELIEIVSQNPKLLERPIVVHEGRAPIGRPPENVLAIF